MTLITQHNYKQQFTDQLKNNQSIYDFILIYEHAKIVQDPSNFEYINSKYLTKTDYTIDCAFDYLNNYTDINFDHPELFQSLDFDKLNNSICEFADSSCDIYFYKAYKTASLFEEYTGIAIDNYGLDSILKKDEQNPLYHLIVIGQYEFYSQFASFILEEFQIFWKNIQTNN